MTPLVSIIMPCRDGAAWLPQSIGSVRAQDFQDWEMIVVDDASTDHSAQFVEQQAGDDARITLIRLSRRNGSAAARNHAIRRARGRFIAFLDADDWWREKKLSTQLAFVQAANVPLSYTAYEKVDADGRRENRVFYPPPALVYRDLLRTCSIGCSTVMLDREKLGVRLMPEIPLAHDYALWLSILREGHRAQGLHQDALTVYRVRADSLSANKPRMLRAVWDIYRVQEKLSLIRRIRLMAEYVIHGLKKRFI